MNKLELLQKIKELASHGVGGEKQNAQAMLDKLMSKYNITDEDLCEEIIKEFDFKTNNKLEKALLGQIAYSVYGNINDKKGYYSYTYIKNKTCIKCTDAEFLEISAKFDFYKKEYKKQQKLFYRAFIHANSIFPDEKLCKHEKESYFLTDEDMKILNLAKGIEKAEFRKRLQFEA